MRRAILIFEADQRRLRAAMISTAMRHKFLRGWTLMRASALLACALCPAAAPALADATAELEAVLARDDYQTELPRSLGDRLAGLQKPQPDGAIDLSGWSFLGWILLAVIAVVLGVLIARTAAEPLQELYYKLRGLRPPQRRPRAPALQPITEVEEGTALERADALARAGRFAEAVRVLLLACIGTVREYAPQAAEDSLTSREVLREAPLHHKARDAFGVLVAAEEAGRFAGRALGAGHYDEARENFGVFAEASREAPA